MNIPIPTTAWILALAVGYLFAVYTLLWWAKRTGNASKRSIF